MLSHFPRDLGRPEQGKHTRHPPASSLSPFPSSPTPASFPDDSARGYGEKGLSQSWVSFKSLQTSEQGDKGGRQAEQDAEGTEEEPRFCQGSGPVGSPFSRGPLATEAPVDGPPKPARPLWLVSVFSNPHEWKERLLKIHHPLRLLFPVKLSAFSLSFLFGMKRSGLFWQPERATEHGFLRPRASLLSKLTAASQGARGVGLAVLG